MVTPKECIAKYGSPMLPAFQLENMEIYKAPDDICEYITVLPRRIYMNKAMIPFFEKALRDIYEKDFDGDIHEWGGCFSIRMMRGVKPPTPSIHSWGIAFDINETAYPQGKRIKTIPGYVKCFIDNGFDWGNNFPIPDPMHFQLSII